MWRSPASARSKRPSRAPSGPRNTGSSGGPGRPARTASRSSYQAIVRARSGTSRETWSMRTRCMAEMVRPPQSLRDRFDADRIVGGAPVRLRTLPAMPTDTTLPFLADPASVEVFDLTVRQEPALVARPRTDAEVVELVAFARERGLQVAPQRTGHN